MNPYRITLKCKNGVEVCWDFHEIETRNRFFDDVYNEFKERKYSKTPFIELDIDNNESSIDSVSVSLPLRLHPDDTKKVISYIDKLVEASQ